MSRSDHEQAPVTRIRGQQSSVAEVEPAIAPRPHTTSATDVAAAARRRTARVAARRQAVRAEAARHAGLTRSPPSTPPRRPGEGPEPLTDPALGVAMNECEGVLVELRQRATALEQVTRAVPLGQHAQQVPIQPDR